MVNSITGSIPQLLPLHQAPDTEAAGAAQRTQGTKGATATPPITDPRERQAAHAYLRDLFSPHRMQMPRDATAEQANAIDAHNRQLDHLAESRADTLLSRGERKADIEAAMKNAFTLDRFATSGTAMVGGIPFAAVAVAQFAKPELVNAPTNFILRNIDKNAEENPLVERTINGAIGGLESHYPDEFFQRLFADAKADRFFLKPPDSKLHDAMTASLAEKKPSLLGEVLEDAKQIQTYLAGAIVTNTISAALIAAGHPEKAEAIEKWAVPLRNYVAGFGTAHWKHSAENNRHQRGEALLLGIKDAEPKDNLNDEHEWLNVYMAAKQGSVWSALGHGGERMADVLLGSAVNSLDALGKALTSANSLGPGVIGLGATFAARSVAQYVASAAFTSPLKQAVIARTINALGTGVAFAVWAALAAVTDPVSNAGKNAVNDYRKSRGTAPDSATTTGANVRARIENTAAGSASLRRRPVRSADLEAQEAIPMRAWQRGSAAGPSNA
ncbi:hypothetical protein [Pseudomonas sp. GL-B-16]|uniref:hypothetical protein n=1 Tax=Pseudomonas sp. GL-B-16 TaxID=2832373 RepID=UPI001CBFA5E6|nr:hypothetical protein [Pseudomonas sp. GL-B-16]